MIVLMVGQSPVGIYRALFTAGTAAARTASGNLGMAVLHGTAAIVLIASGSIVLAASRGSVFTTGGCVVLIVIVLIFCHSCLLSKIFTNIISRKGYNIQPIWEI